MVIAQYKCIVRYKYVKECNQEWGCVSNILNVLMHDGVLDHAWVLHEQIF
ncbi:hypothetical protein ACP70R_021401 [Stipagrostis hirtigluma subsp. patula]